MKKTTILAVALALAISATARNQQDTVTTTIANVFREMPDSLLPSLTKNNRLDLLDFIASKMEADVKNRFDEHTRLPMMNDKYLKLEISPSSVIEMRLLPVATPIDSSNVVVCMAETVGGDEGESTVEIYSRKWRRLRTVDLPRMQLVFPDTMDAERKQKLILLASGMLTKVSLSPTDDKIILTASLPLLSADEKQQLQSFLKATSLSLP